MPDNVTIGSGALVPVDVPTATDLVGGVHYQRVKVSVGADGVVGDATPANPLPVSTAPSTGAAPTAFTATSSTVVFSANTAAKLRTFSNDCDKDLYLTLNASAASVTVYHVKVPASGGFFSTDYTGEIRGILSGSIVTGQVNVGEFT